MRTLRKPFIIFLILLTANLFIARVIFAEQGPTKHPLEIRSTPAEEMPTERVKKPSSQKWLLLVAVLGALALLSQEPEPTPPPPPSTTGSYTGTW